MKEIREEYNKNNKKITTNRKINEKKKNKYTYINKIKKRKKKKN